MAEHRIKPQQEAEEQQTRPMPDLESLCEKDPQYDVEKEKAYLEKVKNGRLPQLEKQRLSFFSKDFDPGNN